MKNTVFITYSFGVLVIGLLWLFSCQSNNNLKDYKGKPYTDSVYQGGAQTLPGKLQCEYYDLGGEGIAYHDTDSLNSGSGALNPADGTYLNQFRMNEPVDISYTKFREMPIDNTIYNFVETEKNQLYVGWTKPGEWVKYTVNVVEEGTYQLGIMFTSNKNGKISISVNDIDATGQILIPSTYVEADTVPWRQWHHWNRIDSIASFDLEKGLQTITLHTVEMGDMNYDYLEFTLLK